MRSAQNVASLPATATDLTPADPERIGPYRPLKRLGAGGMGVVYAAHDASGGLVAVKLIHPEYSADPDFRARFAREVELLHRVGGACAVPLLAADTAAERPWLVTPLVRGLTLGDYVREHGPLPERLLLGLAAGVAEALVRIHAVGIAHRDLKPANVVLSPEGPRVLDFGVARAVDQTALTRTGSIVGSPGWISPDHYRGRPASTADDVFAWGALMAFAATGRQPFGTGDPAVVAHRVISGEPDMDGFTGPLADLARWALAKEAGRRPDAMRLVEAVFALSGPGRGRPPAGTPEAVDGAMATVVDENWQGVPAAPEQVFAIAPRPGGGRAKRGLAVAGAVVGALLLLAGATFGGVVLARSWDTQVVADDVPAEEAGTGGDRRPGAGNEPKPSESPSGEPSESPSEEAGAGDGGGEEEEGGGTSATSTGLVGAGVAAAGARPSGEHVVAFQPDGGAAVYARLDGADVVCAWSFCQSQGGSVGNGSAGSVPSSPSALTGYANQGGRTVRAEVTYTTAADGTVTITRLVEQHRTSGTGTPPW
ncbi:serine/threonine-protein kinase [Nocardiopsis changdeensis]|uniref:Serine/threonine protein kinase n=1 Tax=Nocardiopsis changdeensis TaxID=2831969 RepID=A0ABX8BMI3_9ACTN|nr:MULTISPECIES: serine/threonine-protein kinase [Nocardiopsis]QUX23232.1 serine/threonine protein kinase [Nocardiopsis changdeensis]QYX39174.1 serine/threonine protein kinase [Nocardiopsis sp. MT53]